MRNIIRGWFRPNLKLTDFLENYSKAGGIHHAVLIYGDVVNELGVFANFMNWDFKVLK